MRIFLATSADDAEPSVAITGCRFCAATAGPCGRHEPAGRVALRPDHPTRDGLAVTFSVWRPGVAGPPIAQLWQAPTGWTVYLAAVGIRLSEPTHASVEDALAWHGWSTAAE